MSAFCNYFVEGKPFDSDDAECLEDTFRPSLFRRIDSESSLQSFERGGNPILEHSIPNINVSALTKDDEKETWDVSMLYSLEHEKALNLDFKLKNNAQTLEIAELKEKFNKDQLKEAKSKISITQEQHIIECDYLNTKIEYIQQKNKELESKSQNLEEKLMNCNKDLLLKDKKILWLESEIYAKESRLKVLSELEKEVEKLRHFKESTSLYKDKVVQLESQIEVFKKENRELVNELNKVKLTSQQEVQKLSEEKEKFSKSLELQKMLLQKSEDDLKRSQESLRKIDSESENFKTKVSFLESELSNKSKYTSPCKGSRVVKAVLSILKIEDENDILPKIEELLKLKNYSKFVARLAGLVKDCSPSGTFEDVPSTSQMWKYVRRIMESYIELCKKQQKFVKIFKLIEEADDFDTVKTLMSTGVVN